jgi:hypothetical protein
VRFEDGYLKKLLKQYPAAEMKMWPISQRVNSPKNDDEAILRPFEPDVFNFGARCSDAELPLT